MTKYRKKPGNLQTCGGVMDNEQKQVVYKKEEEIFLEPDAYEAMKKLMPTDDLYGFKELKGQEHFIWKGVALRLKKDKALEEK